MKRLFSIVIMLLVLVFVQWNTGFLNGVLPQNILDKIPEKAQVEKAIKGNPSKFDGTVTLNSAKYPATAKHVREAIKKGKPNYCTIDRDGADKNRDKSLAGIATKKGYDRDEFPMAMCAEGGKGADVKLVPSSDNRGAGASVGSQMRKYKDGDVIKIVVK